MLKSEIAPKKINFDNGRMLEIYNTPEKIDMLMNNNNVVMESLILHNVYRPVEFLNLLGIFDKLESIKMNQSGIEYLLEKHKMVSILFKHKHITSEQLLKLCQHKQDAVEETLSEYTALYDHAIVEEADNWCNIRKDIAVAGKVSDNMDM